MKSEEQFVKYLITSSSSGHPRQLSTKARLTFYSIHATNSSLSLTNSNHGSSDSDSFGTPAARCMKKISLTLKFTLVPQDKISSSH